MSSRELVQEKGISSKNGFSNICMNTFYVWVSRLHYSWSFCVNNLKVVLKWTRTNYAHNFSKIKQRIVSKMSTLNINRKTFCCVLQYNWSFCVIPSAIPHSRAEHHPDVFFSARTMQSWLMIANERINTSIVGGLDISHHQA